MMTGEFKNSVDEKGRLMIPAKLRGEITGNVLILTRGTEKCLWLFPPEEWRQLSDKIMNAASPFNAKFSLIQRRIVAPAQEVEIDKAGRINIPPSLREYAELKKEAVILGIKKYLEIWDEELYDAYLEENEKKFQEAAEELGKLVSF
jgi:MraZ protein